MHYKAEKSGKMAQWVKGFVLQALGPGFQSPAPMQNWAWPHMLETPALEDRKRIPTFYWQASLAEMKALGSVRDPV